MGSEPLRIAQFITQYPYPEQFDGDDGYFCSGAERVASSLSEGLARRGHEVHVFTSSSGRGFERDTYRGVTVHRSPSVAAINTTQIAPSIVIDHVNEEFDVVHAHNSTPPGVFAGHANAAWYNTPFVITHHGGEQYETHGGPLRRGGLYLYTRMLIDRVFAAADRVVTPSEGYIEESRVLSSPDVAVETIPNGVDVDTFDLDIDSAEAKESLGLTPESFAVLYLGSHHERKGVDVLVEAFSSFVEFHPDAELVLAGSGDMTPTLEKAASRFGIEENVTFPGYVPESEKPTYMVAADLFVIPSKTAGAEVFPLVILEATAAGTPVVTSDFPTLRSVVEPAEIGRLVEPKDADALADRLATFTDSELRATYSENAAKMGKRHRWDRIVDQYVDLYRRVIG